jgi:hypothetical protein
MHLVLSLAAFYRLFTPRFKRLNDDNAVYCSQMALTISVTTV